MNDELFDVRETAAYTHFREATIREWILHRKIAYVKLGRRVFIKRKDLDAIIERSVVPALGQTEARAEAR